MPDEISARFFRWIDAKGMKRDDVAILLDIDAETVSAYRSRGLPKKKRARAQEIMDEADAKLSQQVEELRKGPALVVRPTEDQFSLWEKAAQRNNMTLSEWVVDALNNARSEESEDTPNVIPIIPAARPLKAHIHAAAGSPIGAEVEDWDGENNTVLVRINGLSMVPLFNDQDVIPMHHKRGARSQFMKKGLIYLVEYEGGYTVKEYNRRAATADEQGEEWVEDGKVRVLKSRNPAFPEIVIKGDVEWFAWFDPKVDRV